MIFYCQPAFVLHLYFGTCNQVFREDRKHFCMRYQFMVWLWLCVPASLSAQYNFGIGNGNYSGIYGARINPAVTAGSSLRWEVNAIFAGALYDNTFVYIPHGAVPVLGFKSIYNGILHNRHFLTHYDPSNPGKLYQFVLSTEVLGPSVRFNVGTNQSIGLMTVARSYTNMRDLPGSTAQSAYAYLLQADLWNKPLSDHRSRLNGMGWLQYGINYSAILLDDGTNHLKIGLGLNYLQGVAAAYVKNTDLNYSIGDTANLQFVRSGLDYGRTDYDSYRRIGGYGGLNHGHGFSADAGIVFSHKADPNDPSVPYDYRLGVSVMDIGSIDFNRNAAAFHLQTDTANFAAWRQVRLASNIAVDRTLSAIFYHGDSAKSKEADHFSMAMPTALSVQADFRITTRLFVNGTIVKGLHHGDRQGVIQPDLYALTPRLETRWWEVSVPVSLLYYGQWRPRVGLAARVGYFFVGGDAPWSVLGIGDMQGADVYVGIRFFDLK